MKLFRRTACVMLCAAALSGAAQAEQLTIHSANATHAHARFPASNAVNGDTSWASRWAGKGDPETLLLDLGADQTLEDIQIAWPGDAGRIYPFEIEARAGTSGSWTLLVSSTANGGLGEYVNYDVTDMTAQQIRISGTDASYTSISNIKIFGTQNEMITPSPPTQGPVPGDELSISSAVAWNNESTHPRYPASNTIDNDTARASRWANNAQPYPQIVYTLPESLDIGKIGIDWGGSSRKTYEFEIYTRPGTSGAWGGYALRTTTDGGAGEQFYTLDVNARQVRVKVLSNNLGSPWASITEVKLYEPGAATPPTPPGSFGLDPALGPWDNFDLSAWVLQTPAPRLNDACKADRILDDKWEDENPFASNNPASANFFYTHTDGGMRFETRLDGATTSESCTSGRVRSELRGMLRAGDTSIADRGVTANNWALGYQPSGGNWGGRNGTLNATLRVNKVTTTGSGEGRVIIGQIHAEDNEPVRLYYRYRASQNTGCVYAASEAYNGDETDIDVVGNESCTISASNGIAMDELFSYTIENDFDKIYLTVRRGDFDGPIIGIGTIDLEALSSNYDRSDEWMYFKAGAYTQNDTGDDSDGDIVTFYRLSHSHDPN